MPPKRKAAGKAPAKGGKKAKKEEAEAAPETVQDKIQALKKADAGKKKSYKVDTFCPMSSYAEVYDDFDCMLNQTNIGHNNNKYYVIQLLKHNNGNFYTWNRWGRVGESGQNALKAFSKVEDAAKDFEKKFRDKTKNDWKKRDDFKPVPGKYTLIEMACEDEDDVDAAAGGGVVASGDDEGKTVLPCKLDKATQGLIKLIFDHDMFRDAMKSFDIDVKKMPLGKLGKAQIAKGFEVLDEIDAAISNKSPKSKLNDLSSRFYTVIPHDFGRTVPPTIQNAEQVQKKIDMLNVLADIELAHSLEKDKKVQKKGETVPHPFDVNYELLKCGLEHVPAKTKEFKTLETYTNNTMGWRKVKIQDIWKVNRDGETDRFKTHDKLGNRKLLWHGTNVAVVAAILKSGLRIMPHSGGRVGRGIYFASENGKSAGYVGCANKTGIMFLNEVALGKEHHILRDDSSLRSAPKGFDSVVARGQTEPDPKKDTEITIDGKKIVVPQGQPVKQSDTTGSYFSQSEYLVYKESQCHIRYMLKLTFSY